MESLRRAIAAAVFCALLVVYLNTIGDLPSPMGAPNYSIGQLTP